MTTFCRVAIVAFVALAAAGPSWAQDFSQFKAGPRKTDESNKAAYAGLSDTQGPSYVNHVAFESVSDADQAPATSRISDTTTSTSRISDFGAVAVPARGSISDIGDLATDVDDGGVSQASLLSPSCGAAAGPECGIAGTATCGLPIGSDCGLPGSACWGSTDVSCGIPSLTSGTSCGGCDTCGGCGEIACGSLCTRQCPTCCGVGTHYSRVYGELLYLRARNAEVAYAVPFDGPLAQNGIPVQVGDVGILDPDYELGFRAGANIALDTVSSLDVRYTLFESLTGDETSQIAPFLVRSLVTHPSTLSAADDVLSSVASLEIDFDFIDASYRHLLKCSDVFAINYVVGGRYAKLEQQFDVEFVKNGLETVSTDIDFDGAGMRLGLETERYSCRNQLHVYANGYASFLAGRFRAHYFQGDAFDQSVVDAEWEAGRIVPILDLECGVGWTSVGGKLRLNAGYMVSAWFNSVTTQDYINAIQRNDFLSLSDTVTFDGLQARFEYRF